MWNVQCVSLVDMTRFASFRTQTIAEVPCHVIFFCEALYRWHGTYAFFCFFHFTDDMGVIVFWVCSTTPMSSAGTIHGNSPLNRFLRGCLIFEGRDYCWRHPISQQIDLKGTEEPHDAIPFCVMMFAYFCWQDHVRFLCTHLSRGCVWKRDISIYIPFHGQLKWRKIHWRKIHNIHIPLELLVFPESFGQTQVSW